MMGGVSQAAVEGAVTKNEFFLQVFSRASYLLLLSHIFIIPWIMFSLFRIQKASLTPLGKINL